MQAERFQAIKKWIRHFLGKKKLSTNHPTPESYQVVERVFELNRVKVKSYGYICSG